MRRWPKDAQRILTRPIPFSWIARAAAIGLPAITLISVLKTLTWGQGVSLLTPRGQHFQATTLLFIVVGIPAISLPLLLGGGLLLAVGFAHRHDAAKTAGLRALILLWLFWLGTTLDAVAEGALG